RRGRGDGAGRSLPRRRRAFRAGVRAARGRARPGPGRGRGVLLRGEEAGRRHREHEHAELADPPPVPARGPSRDREDLPQRGAAPRRDPARGRGRHPGGASPRAAHPQTGPRGHPGRDADRSGGPHQPAVSRALAESRTWPAATLLSMTFNEGVRGSSRRVRTSSGGRGRGMAIGGGLGGGGLILVLAIMLLTGQNPAELLDGGTSQGGSEPGMDLSHCETGADANEHTECRMVLTADALDVYWEGTMAEQTRQEYVMPGFEIFTGSVATGCGSATSAVGPFYCPADSS